MMTVLPSPKHAAAEAAFTNTLPRKKATGGLDSIFLTQSSKTTMVLRLVELNLWVKHMHAHTLSLYKLPPYLTMFGHCNPMSLLWHRFQSHESMLIHMLTKDDALDLIQLLTNFLYDTCQPDWTTLTTHQQISLILGEPPSTLPKTLHHVWLKSTLPTILDYVSHLKKLLYYKA